MKNLNQIKKGMSKTAKSVGSKVKKEEKVVASKAKGAFSSLKKKLK